MDIFQDGQTVEVVFNGETQDQIARVQAAVCYLCVDERAVVVDPQSKTLTARLAGDAVHTSVQGFIAKALDSK